MTRDRDGGLNLLLNRCAHRANLAAAAAAAAAPALPFSHRLDLPQHRGAHRVPRTAGATTPAPRPERESLR